MYSKMVGNFFAEVSIFMAIGYGISFWPTAKFCYASFFETGTVLPWRNSLVPKEPFIKTNLCLTA